MSLIDYIYPEQCGSAKILRQSSKYKANVSKVMGCSPSREQDIILRENEHKKMLIHDITVKKNPWTESPFEADVEYDPWEGSMKRSILEKRNSVRVLSPPKSSLSSTSGENVSIVDLRAQSVLVNASKKFAVESKTSESQTDNPDGVDFDWDLTDKTDIETQTSPPSRADSITTEPLDAIIQTDQRIVFQSGKRVTFNIEDADSVVKTDRQSQTTWDVTDQETQVTSLELGEDDPWSLSRTFESSYLDSGLGLEFSESQNLDSSPHLLDDDLDEHLAFVHKSSVLSRRTPTNKQERSKEVGIQTDAYRHFLQGTHTEPQADTKVDFLGDDPFFFEECDDHVQVVSRRWYKSLRKLVKHLTSIVGSVTSYQDRRELVSVRAFFVWITQNIRFDPDNHEESPVIDLLRNKTGSCKDFVNLFKQMCQIADIEVAVVQGYIKEAQYVPGSSFSEADQLHHWIAVVLEGNWRLVDPVCGAGLSDTKRSGSWHPELSDNFFLTDPEEFIYTHFPHDKSDPQYFRWQLLLPPLSQDQFVSAPHLSSHFFHNGLELETEVRAPWLVQDSAVLRLGGWEVMRYRYRLYPSTEAESEALNNYCFCHLEEEDRATAAFQICPPHTGSYILRIYGTPEANFSLGQPATMDFLASFLIECTRVYPKVSPWPLSDLPWGLTGDYFHLGLSMVIDDPTKWHGPRIILKVGSKAVFKFVHAEWPILSSVALFDAQNNQLVQEKESVTYYLNSSVDKEGLKTEIINGKLKAYVSKKSDSKETLFTVLAPPSVGYYKLVINAARVPKVKAKVIMPVVATFLVELLELPKKRDKSAGGGSLSSIGSAFQMSRAVTKLASIAETDVVDMNTSLVSGNTLLQETSLTVNSSGQLDTRGAKSKT